MSLNLVIDLDGTLAEWETGTGDDGGGPGGGFGVGGWIEGQRPGEPGAKEMLTSFLEEGHEVVVHSCRATWADGGGWQAIAKFLYHGGFAPYLVNEHDQWERVVCIPHRSNGPQLPQGAPWIGVDELAFPPGMKMPKVGIWTGIGKPRGHYYIDDRAIEFTGSWSEVADRINERHALWVAGQSGGS